MPFIEDPFLHRIVNCHFGSGSGGTPPPPPSPYCGSYGYGEIMAEISTPSGSLITGVPYGPILQAPFAGEFFTIAPNGIDGNDGGLLHPLPFGDTRTSIQGAAYGLTAQNIELSDNLTFTNFQLLELLDPSGNPAPNGWLVPMAYGGVGVAPDILFNRVVSYSVDMAWNCDTAESEDEVGLAITRLGDPAPTAPDVVLGPRSAGSATYVYDLAANGNALLWWMTWRGPGTSWVASNQFMGSILLGLGDNYTWTITASCALES